MLRTWVWGAGPRPWAVLSGGKSTLGLLSKISLLHCLALLLLGVLWPSASMFIPLSSDGNP